MFKLVLEKAEEPEIKLPTYAGSLKQQESSRKNIYFCIIDYAKAGTPLQYSCLENPMDGGAWWAAVHEVANSWTRLSDFTFTFLFSCTGEGNGNPLQYSCLENLRDDGAWWAAVYGVTQSRTRLK